MPPATCKEFGDPVRFVTVIPLANVIAPLAPEMDSPVPLSVVVAAIDPGAMKVFGIDSTGVVVPVATET